MGLSWIGGTVLKAGGKHIIIFGFEKAKSYQNYIAELFKNDDDVLVYREEGQDRYYDLKKKKMVNLE